MERQIIPRSLGITLENKNLGKANGTKKCPWKTKTLVKPMEPKKTHNDFYSNSGENKNISKINGTEVKQKP